MEKVGEDIVEEIAIGWRSNKKIRMNIEHWI